MTITDILCLPGWKAGEVQEAEDRTIIKASLTEVPLACPLCGSVQPPYRFGKRPIQIADLPIRMKPVTILARRRRYQCRDCGKTFMDQLPGVHQEHEATERLVSYVQVQALHLTQTFTGLSTSLGISEWLVRDIVASHIETLECNYAIQTPRYLGIDEIYVEDAIYCVLTDLERHAVVDLLAVKRDYFCIQTAHHLKQGATCLERIFRWSGCLLVHEHAITWAFIDGRDFLEVIPHNA